MDNWRPAGVLRNRQQNNEERGYSVLFLDRNSKNGVSSREDLRYLEVKALKAHRGRARKWRLTSATRQI